jgi:hypothetical protein
MEYSPQIGVDADAPVGGVLFAQADYVAAERAVASKAYSRQLGLGGRIIVTNGEQFVRSRVDGKDAFCSSGATYSALGGDLRSVCYFDDGNVGRFSRAYIVNTLASQTFDVSIPYVIKELPTGTGTKQEVVYAGSSGRSLRLIYNEYRTGQSGPTESQALTFDIGTSMPAHLGFRGFAMDVASVSGNIIRYRVNAGFK